MSDHREPDNSAGGGGHGASEPDLFEARITGTEDQLATMLRSFDLDIGCRHAHVDRNADGTATMLVFASEESIAALQERGYRAEKGENVSARGRELWKEVGRGDRFEAGGIAPRGLGDKGRGEPRGTGE